MKCSPLLLSSSSIPPYHPPPPGLSVLSIPPLPVHSVDSRRLLVGSARRRETAAIRERWKQHQQQARAKSATSRSGHTQSAAAVESSLTPSRNALLGLPERLAACGLGPGDENDVPCKERPLQFPQLEQELTKRNLTQRLPYFVKLEVEEEGRMDYPNRQPSYSQVFFLSPHGAHKPSSPPPTNLPRARCLRSDRGERFFIHPEWSSEEVEWRRFVHQSNPARFRYSWM